MTHRRWEMLDWVVLSVFLVVTLVWSFRPLADVDLGWHLAGGLWILDNHAVPQSDPLSAGARFWLCYSWLPEVAFALIFRAFSYRGLQLAQVVSILASVVFVYWFVCSMHRPAIGSDEDERRLSGRLAELFTFSIVLLLVAPVWHLRPQLLSVVLFGVMLALADSARLNLKLLLPLTIFWANVHVYWIASPLIAGVYLVFRPLIERQLVEASRGIGVCLLLVLSGALTPYLFQTYPALVEYMFFHKEANRLIKEFQPVVPRVGALFWLLSLVTLLLLISAKQIRRRIRIESILLAVLFLVMAFLRRKYLPLFGLTAVPLLVNAAFPAIFSRFGSNRPASPVPASPASASQNRLLAVLIALFFVLAVTSIQVDQPLTDRYRELFDVTKEIESAVPAGTSPVVIGNHFDDGGWLELAFYLQRETGRSDSRFKTAIDGRTLVMGQERLKQFGDMYFSPGDEKSCQTLKSWNPAAFILPKDDRFTQQFYGGEKLLPCLNGWRFEERGAKWVVGLPIAPSAAPNS